MNFFARFGSLSVVVLITVILGVSAMVFFFNANPVDPVLEELPAEMPASSDPAFARTLAKILHTPLVEGNAIEFLEDGEAIFDRKLEAIRQAERTITMEIYEFWGEEVAGTFAEALAERAENGVAVHAIFDFVGSQKASEDKLDLMRDSGVEVILYRKPSWYRSSRFNFRTHRKLLVVDGRVGFTGGANLADAWIGEEGYRDHHFRFTGPIVGYLQSSFLENYKLATGTILLGEDYFPELEETGDQIMQVVISSPREGQKRIRTMLLMLFASAESHIRICTGFLYPDPLLIAALIEARKRGVEVDILAPGEKIAEKWVRYASRNIWGPILESGIRIHEYQPRNLHAKIYIIDEAFVSMGSANFHNRSFRLNDETNINIFSPETVHQAIEVFTNDLSDAREITLSEWENRPWRERFRGVIGNLIGPHL